MNLQTGYSQASLVPSGGVCHFSVGSSHRAKVTFRGRIQNCLLCFLSGQAWSSIVYQLIPNVQQLETNLRNFAQIIEADEVLLFERATFLVRDTTAPQALPTLLLLLKCCAVLGLGSPVFRLHLWQGLQDLLNASLLSPIEVGIIGLLQSSSFTYKNILRIQRWLLHYQHFTDNYLAK